MLASRISVTAPQDMIRCCGTPSALSLWSTSSTAGKSNCRLQGVSQTPPSSHPMSQFTPFWVRPCNVEPLPAPVTISYVDYFPAPSEDDDSDYMGYEDEDEDNFVEEETHPLKKAMTKMAAFWRRLFN